MTQPPPRIMEAGPGGPRTKGRTVAELARRVGLGLASRGDADDVVRYARAAERGGLHSVWLHESYFERDAVTYASAIASAVPRIRVGLGAVNPYTRHPVLLAMTMSSLDDMAPGRIILGMGSALPLRLGQMGIPYDPEDAIARAESAVDVVRRLGRGERLPAGREGLPELAPMYPPVNRIPVYAAGYRKAYVEFAGRVCDGYLARPAEPVDSLRVIVGRLRDAALAAGRDPDDVDVAGYLLSLVDTSRRAALDRAKREPFVIYMVAVQSEVAMRRAGLDPSIRGPVMDAWRAEDYTRAARLIPDEVVDSVILCGTPEQVAARADEYRQAGMDLPLLQPVVQDDEQTEGVIQAAVHYGRATAPAVDPAPVGAGAAARAETADAGRGLARVLRATTEITRPFSLTAAVMPVLAAGGLALTEGVMSWAPFVAALVASVLLQVGTNVTNEIYDVRRGVDDITTPRMSHAIVTGRMNERSAFTVVAAAFTGAVALGAYLLAVRGWPIAVLGLLGLVGGWGYTAPPLEYKFRALGLPLVFLLMGPLMVLGGYYAASGSITWQAAVVSLPIGLLVTAILQGNEWRDAADDARAGISTASIRYGPRFAHTLYIALVVGAFVVLGLAAAFRGVPPAAMLAAASLPLLVRTIRAAELGANGQRGAIARIDLETARLHAAFGGLLAAGLALGQLYT